jgi:hypothetical protein
MSRALAALAAALLLAGCLKTEKAVEYVKVKYPFKRAVYIDGAKNGSTNEVLRVDTGAHRFDLGPETDYQPATRTVLVKDTTALAPLVVEFKVKQKGGR